MADSLSLAVSVQQHRPLSAPAKVDPDPEQSGLIGRAEVLGAWLLPSIAKMQVPIPLRAG